MRLNGTMLKRTSVLRSVTEEKMAVPAAMMLSSGMWNSFTNCGIRYHALNRLPNTVITSVPSVSDQIAPFLLSVA